ncbi:26034_t:CDS:2 [Dentiscutata erythropus]|uniref:Calcium-transporting ATPase n=1 Tax=Dentiscutata erythropus TaxID=1348616 RepID=A0A9N8Z077_9GLOM|nr:26034_t:CDS:2 [Dentiscutata erythropus]
MPVHDHEEGLDKTPTNIPIIVIESSQGEVGGNTDTPETQTNLLSLSNVNKSDLTLCSSVSTKVELEEMSVSSDKQKMARNDKSTYSINTGPFAYTSIHLWKMMNHRDFELLKSIGGLDGIIEGLRTHRTNGLNTTEESKLLPQLEKFTNIPDDYKDILDKIPDDNETNTHFPNPPDNTLFSDRIRLFGKNVLPETKSKSIFEFMWLAMQDKVLILLTIAAIISLGLGLYEDFSESSSIKVRWIEGVAIIIAILIVVLVGSVNDWQKERQFRSLNAKKEDREVKVMRDGKPSLISIHDVLVGDILQLEPGDVIPADGILISGYNIYCDQSDETGESDSIRKFTYDDCVKRFSDSDSRSSKLDPFIISGSRVLEGIGTYVVTGVGINSCRGKTWIFKLNDLAEQIAKLGGAAALLMLIVLLIKYFISFVNGVPTAASAISSLVMIVISAVTVVVVAVPEGLPLAVTLALAYATTRMLKDNNLVRILSSCETMGNATTICSDKTGTLTQNRMTVVVTTIGLSDSFTRNTDVYMSTLKSSNIKGFEKNISSMEDIKNLPDPILEILYKSIAINTTAFEGEPKNGKPNFVGSKTETALLQLLLDLDVTNYKQLKEDAKIIQFYPFGSERKAMGLVVQEDSRFRFYVKGASEMLLQKSRYTIDTKSDNKPELNDQEKDTIQQIITYYANQSLRTLAIAYRDFEQWPPSEIVLDPDGEVKFENLMVDITLLCIVGIEDPLREGVRQAILDCRDAGVKVRMVTGDNILTAKSIAKQCGIYTDGTVMEGPEFRNLSDDKMREILPKLQVLARSSPEDKKLLVGKLKQELNDIVAVTGDGTNDGPALRTADVGFSMGISGTEAAKEASSIILMDDNFSSIVKAIMWGRCVNDAVKKFLQFQLTVNVTAVMLTFISAVSSDQQQSVLTAVQLLWVNLIMDTFAALALATDPPTPELLKRKPENREAPLITPLMWKMIIGQSIFQLAITLILLYAADDIVGHGVNEETLNTIVFNAFVMLQIFNEINCRNLDEKLNVFKNILSNRLFVVIFLITCIGQFLIVQYGGEHAFQTVPLDIIQWLACIGLGFLSIPVGIIIRLIPIDRLFVFPPQKRAPTISDDESAVTRWQKQLKFFKVLRGGGRFRSHFGGNETQKPQAFAGVAVVPSFIVQAVAVPSSTSRNHNKDDNDSRALQRSIPMTQLKQRESDGSSKNSIASQDDKIEVQNHY